MKKFLFVCVAFAAVTLFSNSASAQVKIGYFDEQAALSLFPGIAKIDTLLNSYRLDSLQEEYKYNVSDFQRRDSIFKKDSATMPAKARELATRELLQLRYKLVNWQEYSQQMEQAKYEELVNPYREKLYAAVQEVVSEQKYTLVLKAETISPYARPNLLDNITIRVAQKLKLPLPKDIEDAWKAAAGSGSAPAKPAAKPAGKG
ncbi:OmpH family outer membrane protein [Sediminibacterium sp.]|jgi:Skp family chaperone for outer membrane proteins|uniref:OmpH family outer membrane protein n=1 Tax=Sediminibacterium sp. TaxID=1917865 RepID=UPI0025FBCC8F|nr:OmpH family outer membrane protein [Sediminibacterium sp.]MBT9484242.1 OmpH family outer membrane protein [Sediminibacterium sp.]